MTYEAQRVPISVPTGEWNLMRTGTRIQDKHTPNRRGTVTGWARGFEANQRFAKNKADAHLAGRELTPDDYECLIDNEGPVIAFDNGVTDWFPGQSIGCIETI